MKISNTFKLALTSILFGLLFNEVQSAQITVSKDPNRVAQYTDLQLAVDEAANGDTILVYGATNNYGSVTLYKPLTLIGEGYNDNISLIPSISYLYVTNFNSTLGASGSTIMGFNIYTQVQFQAYFSGSDASTQILSDITFLRNRIDDISFSAGSTVDTYTNINFINNVISSYIYFDSYSYEDSEDVTFSNCIFDGVYISGSLIRSSGVLSQFQNLSNVKIYNSLFINTETGLLNNTVGIVLEDNIFFGHELFGSDYAQTTFNNNIFYLVDQTTNLLTNDNVGANNQIDVNPLFTNYPSTPAAFSYAHDYTLQAGSPGLTASVSGGEVGIYGGAYPFAVGAQPPVPKVTEVTIQDGTSSVPVGGTINFNFKAQSGN